MRYGAYLILATAALAAIAWLLLREGTPATTQPRVLLGPPDVVLVVIDTLRADHVHGYGYPRETTPHLDRLIAEGARFDAAVAHSSWSAPSHASIATGTLPIRHGVRAWGDALPDDVPPLARLLRRRGYATGLFSSHYILHKSVGGMAQGFDASVVRPHPADAEVLDAASRWAAQQAGPYFLQVVMLAPHAPYTSYPPSYDDEYFSDEPPGGDRRYPFLAVDSGAVGGIPRSVRLGDHDRLGFYVNRYDRGVRFADELLGGFLTRLQQSGKLDNALLIVTSDHGEGLGDHDAFAHGMYLYDFLVRVPLIVHHPGVVPAGQVWRQQVQLVDIVPTILGFARARLPDHLDGIDLSPYLMDDTRPPDDRVALGSHLHRKLERFMVRSTDYKLLYDAGSGTSEFYHLASDPRELRDLLEAPLSDRSEHAYLAHAAELRRLLEEYAGAAQAASPAELTQDVVEQLEALGYAE